MTNIADAVEALQDLEQRLEAGEQTIRAFVGIPDRVKALEDENKTLKDEIAALKGTQPGGDRGLEDRVKALEETVPELRKLVDAIADLKPDSVETKEPTVTTFNEAGANPVTTEAIIPAVPEPTNEATIASVMSETETEAPTPGGTLQPGVDAAEATTNPG